MTDDETEFASFAPGEDNAAYPARYWHTVPDGRVQCDLCPRECRLREGQRGFCFVRMRQGDRLVLVSAAGTREVRCSAVEMRRKKLDVASAGQTVGLLLDDLAKDQVSTGDVLRSS